MPFETFLAHWITNNQQTRTVEPENYYNDEDPGMQIVAPLINDAHRRQLIRPDSARAGAARLRPARRSGHCASRVMPLAVPLAAAALPLLLAAAGRRRRPAAAARAAARRPRSRRRGRQSLGIGEPRKPEPFTIEQRLLDAVRRDDRPHVERALELGAPSTPATTSAAASCCWRCSTPATSSSCAGCTRGRRRRRGGQRRPHPAQLRRRTTGRLDIVRWLVEQGAVVDRPRRPAAHAALPRRGVGEPPT